MFPHLRVGTELRHPPEVEEASPSHFLEEEEETRLRPVVAVEAVEAVEAAEEEVPVEVEQLRLQEPVSRHRSLKIRLTQSP